MHCTQHLDRSEAGRSLGYDLYVYRSSLELTRASQSVREGFAHAASRRPARTLPDRFARKWLQLRCNAHARGRAFDAQVTPALLRSLDVVECPITRVTLTHGALIDSDWSVDRLNNDAGYAANNLAVMSTRANAAKGSRTIDQVLQLAGGVAATDGLQPVEWMRMAAMMLGPCFATAPRLAPMLPHIVPVSSHRLLLANQQVQHVLCTMTATQAGKNRLIKAFREACAGDSPQLKLRVLADTVHAGRKGLVHACDVWLRADAFDALRRWRDALDDASWARVAEIARQLAGGRQVAPQRLQSWQLGSRGYAH